MKTKKMFPCKIEDLPVIAETIVGSARRDIADFSDFSPEFTGLYFDAIDAKIVVCGKKLRSWVVVRELKTTTELLVSKTYQLRPKLNLLEGYLKLSTGSLDVKESDLGLAVVRNAISKGNTEGVVLSVTNLLAGVRRNQAALEAKGMNPLLIDEIAALAQDINTLDVKQNEQESIRNRLTEENIDLFNDLWKTLVPVLETGKALYRIVDEAKLKDYTVAQLIKRLNRSGKKKTSAE
jgi:ribosomal protein S7